MTKVAETKRGASKFWTYDGVDFLHARYANDVFVPHFHDEYSITVIVDGAMGFDLGRAQHCASPASIALINPGEVHTGHPGAEKGWQTRNILLPTAALRRFAPHLDKLPYFAGPVVWDWPAACALVAAHKATEPGAPATLAADVRIAYALGELFGRHSTGKPNRPEPRASTKRAQDYLQAHFAEKVRLATLAELAGLSPFHFIRTFARDTGLTPHAFQSQLRVAYAVRLLRRGVPSAQAASESGFADQSHLIRAVKRSYGVTPGQVLRAA